MNPHLRYRPDIDGLRAVAVIPVLLFHLRAGPLTGGFIGVDVFFVISGYLIGRIILEGAQNATFSVTQFYVRRILRILPAMLVMIALTTIGAVLMLMPVELESYGSSLVSAALSYSNIHFWLTADYFGTDADTAALLHTWSLAVEEQFYIVLPPLVFTVMAIARRRLGAALIGLTLSSFLWSLWSVSNTPDAAFYLLPSRAWELGIGVLLAHGYGDWNFRPWQRQAVASAGFAAIMASFLLATSKTPFPGLAALPACAGAGAIILAGRSGSTWVGRFLAIRPMTFVGAISYSLYLWHWPIIVAQHVWLVFGDGLTTQAEKGLLIFVSFAAAILSWRFVERPFRRMADTARPAKVFAIAAGIVATFGVIGFALVRAKGLPNRIHPEIAQVAAYLDYEKHDFFRQDSCFVAAQRPAEFDAASCLRRSPIKPNYLVLGDSYAAHLWWGLARAMRNANVMQATAGGCPPVPGGSYPRCRALMQFMLDDYLAKERPDGVWYAANWVETPSETIFAQIDRLSRRGIPVVLVGPVPRYDKPLPRLLALAQMRSDPALPERHLLPKLAKLDRELSTRAAMAGISYVSLYKTLCPKQKCLTRLPGGVPTQFDEGHFTYAGSAAVAPALIAAMQENRLAAR
ncbi:acyltransferase family protein [Sphingomonas sp. PB4P5]|uniref:acyltransferase family protein n=1 Tax=Parasphingomonas puruogangriensis TaxID=3096155 RepID=UPI002FCAEF26